MSEGMREQHQQRYNLLQHTLLQLTMQQSAALLAAPALFAIAADADSLRSEFCSVPAWRALRLDSSSEQIRQCCRVVLPAGLPCELACHHSDAGARRETHVSAPQWHLPPRLCLTYSSP